MKTKLVVFVTLTLSLSACGAPNLNKFVARPDFNCLSAGLIVSGETSDNNEIIQTKTNTDPTAPVNGTTSTLDGRVISSPNTNSTPLLTNSSTPLLTNGDSVTTSGDTEQIFIKGGGSQLAGEYKLSSYRCNGVSANVSASAFFGANHVAFEFVSGSKVEIHILPITYSNPSGTSGSFTLGVEKKKLSLSCGSNGLQASSYTFQQLSYPAPISYSLSGNSLQLSIPGDPVCQTVAPTSTSGYSSYPSSYGSGSTSLVVYNKQ